MKNEIYTILAIAVASPRATLANSNCTCRHETGGAVARFSLAIHESWDAIEYKYRRLDAPARRAIAREWGVIYVSRPGEAPEPGVDPAPTEGGGGTGADGTTPP